MIRKIGREVRLARRPSGLPSSDTFEVAEVGVPDPQSGEILVRNIWMSVDPYMRGRMWNIRSYIEPFQIGKALEGGCVGQVIVSKNSMFSVGDYVMSMLGWREFWASDGGGVTKVNPGIAPIQSFLGALGMPGLTAYAGLLRIARLQEHETVFVSAAAGAVGSIACQIAKAKSCRVIGSAGTDAKVAWLRDECRLDHAFNYNRVAEISAELSRSAPEGVDVYFDNVGGAHLEAALANMKSFGRIVLCGMISQYNAQSPAAGPKSIVMAITKRLRLQGFIVTDHADLMGEFQTEMARWIAAGTMRWKETVVEGIENAPAAFIGLFSGDNIGKMLVRIGPDPAV